MKDDDVTGVTPAAADLAVDRQSIQRRVRRNGRREPAVKAKTGPAAQPRENKAVVEGTAAIDLRRKVLADVCKVFGDHLSSSAGPGEELGLPPRLQQTLRRLMHGD